MSWSGSQQGCLFATEEGAVTVPIAGLHFDPELLSELREKGILMNYVILWSLSLRMMAVGRCGLFPGGLIFS